MNPLEILLWSSSAEFRLHMHWHGPVRAGGRVIPPDHLTIRSRHATGMAACQIRVRPQGRMSSPSTGDDSQPHEHENTSKQRGKVIARYLAGGAHLLWFANQYVLESACNRTSKLQTKQQAVQPKTRMVLSMSFSTLRLPTKRKEDVVMRKVNLQQRQTNAQLHAGSPFCPHQHDPHRSSSHVCYTHVKF